MWHIVSLGKVTKAKRGSGNLITMTKISIIQKYYISMQTKWQYILMYVDKLYNANAHMYIKLIPDYLFEER